MGKGRWSLNDLKKLANDLPNNLDSIKGRVSEMKPQIEKKQKSLQDIYEKKLKVGKEVTEKLGKEANEKINEINSKARQEAEEAIKRLNEKAYQTK